MYFIRHIKSGNNFKVFKGLNLKKQIATCKELHSEHIVSEDTLRVSDHHQKAQNQKDTGKTTGYLHRRHYIYKSFEHIIRTDSIISSFKKQII